MKIIIGSDHAGYELKAQLSEFLSSDHSLEDVGCTAIHNSCDYPVYAGAVCSRILEAKGDFGILICGSGLGMSMAANKYRGIRAALCGDLFTARMSRLHNDANILCLSQWQTKEHLAQDIVKIFINTLFEGGRHIERIKQLESAS